MQSNLNLFIRPDMIAPSQRGSPLYKDLPSLLRQKQFFSTYWKKSYWYLNRVSTIFVFNFFYFYLIFSWEDLKSHSTPHTTIHNQLSYISGQFLRASSTELSCIQHNCLCIHGQCIIANTSIIVTPPK